MVEEFGEVPGLRVGLEKSIAFPIRPSFPTDYLENSGLHTFHTFKYLGVYVHNDISNYEVLNIAPIISQMTYKLRT